MSGHGLDIYKDSFNYWLSHSHQAVEHAFGMLTQRFGIFRRIFKFSFDRWSLVVTVCMKLHNMCIDIGCTVPPLHFVEDIRDEDEWAVHDNAREDDALHRERALGERRREITAKLEHLGVVRPPHASMNSRCS